MPIKVTCSSCGKTLNAPDDAAGKRAKCPGCGNVITVPSAVQEAELLGAAAAAPAAQASYGIAEPTPAAASTGGEQRQPCPECGEMIIVGAVKCRFCNAIFDPKLKQMGGGTSEKVKQIAREQKNLMYCILFYLIASIGSGVVNASAGPGPRNEPSIIGLVVGLVALVAIIAAVVFVIRLAAKLYSTGMAIVYGILTIIPCVGLIIMLVVNGAATKLLKENGVKVGFMGADMSQL
jgi:predicted RNA-binding Zn-ribbon protein involved in translation (DUF1610 family)